MTMFVRYIEEAKLTIFRSKHEADRFGALEIAPEHILLALLSDPALVNGTLKGVPEKEMREQLTRTFLGGSQTRCHTICR